MSDEFSHPVNSGRRHFLTIAGTVVGAMGVGAVATPFVASMEPSRRAAAAAGPIQVDISKIEPGQMITAKWRQKPVWILHRTPKQLQTIPTLDGIAKDPKSVAPQQLPEYANEYRSLKKKYLVVIGICTHLGCIPDYKPKAGSVSPSWKGGFFCPCHGSHYDLAGRVQNGSPAPLNLPVPPYYFVDNTQMRVGELENGSHSDWRPPVW